MRESLEDLRKKYRGTFCFIELNGKKHLAEYTDDNGEDCFYFRSPEYGEILIDRDTVDTSLTYKFPEVGLYNLNGQAANFTRTPERQWKRAPFRENCFLQPILNSIGVNISGRFDINLHTLDEVYKELYPDSLERAVDSLKYSAALNKNFAVSHSLSNNRDEFIFWFQTQPIGTLFRKEKRIEISFSYLYQEAADFIRTKEPTWLLMKAQQSLT
jgi:hypothetical protein